MVATLSLTPRATSSGLRKPRESTGASHYGPYPAVQSPRSSLPDARRKPSVASSEDSDAPPVPTHEELRSGARCLRERRVVATLVSDHQMVSDAIRERTKLTLKTAFAESGADKNAGREAELQRQLMRLEDLRRTFDTLHAELVTKEGMKRMVELELAIDTLGSTPLVGKQQVQGHGPVPVPVPVPVPPPGNPPASSSGRRRSMPRSRGGEGSVIGSGGSSGGASPRHRASRTSHASSGDSLMFGDAFRQRSLTEIMWEGPTPVALEQMAARVNEAIETLAGTLHDCEVYAHMEHRQADINHKLGGQIDNVRHAMGVLAKDEAKLRVLEEEAQQGVQLVRKQLAETKAAHAEQQRSHEDIKTQRQQFNKAKKDIKKREDAFVETERNAKLDGQGELTAEGEEALRHQATDVHMQQVTLAMEREKLTKEQRRVEEIFQKLRRATRDPEKIATPQDLMVSMLSAKDTTAELQGRINEAEECQRMLTDERDQLKAELYKHMYGVNSITKVHTEAEKEVEPALAAAIQIHDGRKLKYNSARSLLLELKQGLTLIAHLALGDALDKTFSDYVVPTSLERIEKHLIGILQSIDVQTTRKTRDRSVSAMAAEKVSALVGEEGKEHTIVADAAVAAAEEARKDAADAAAVAAEARVAVAAVLAAKEVLAATAGLDTDAPPTAEQIALVEAAATAEKLAAAKATMAEEKAAAAEGAAAAGTKVGAPFSSSSPMSKRTPGAHSFSSPFVNNVRIFTIEEMEELVDNAGYEDEEGIDADGKELKLSCRKKLRGVVLQRRKKGDKHEEATILPLRKPAPV